MNVFLQTLQAVDEQPHGVFCALLETLDIHNNALSIAWYENFGTILKGRPRVLPLLCNVYVDFPGGKLSKQFETACGKRGVGINPYVRTG